MSRDDGFVTNKISLSLSNLAKCMVVLILYLLFVSLLLFCSNVHFAGSSGEKKSGLYRYCWPGVVTAVSQSHKIVWGISIAEESLKLLPNHPLQCL